MIGSYLHLEYLSHPAAGKIDTKDAEKKTITKTSY